MIEQSSFLKGPPKVALNRALSRLHDGKKVVGALIPAHFISSTAAIVGLIACSSLALAQRSRSARLDDAQIRVVLMKAYNLLNTNPSIENQQERDAEAFALLSLVVKQPFSNEKEKQSIAFISTHIGEQLGKQTDAMVRFTWRTTLYTVAFARAKRVTSNGRPNPVS
jgi:hypothetical protein